MSLTPNGEGEGLSLTGLPAVSALSSEVGREVSTGKWEGNQRWTTVVSIKLKKGIKVGLGGFASITGLSNGYPIH